MTASTDPAWTHDGVRVVPANRLDANTAQTPGMERQAAINFARVSAQKPWAGTVHIHPGAKTGTHHHGTAGTCSLPERRRGCGGEPGHCCHRAARAGVVGRPDPSCTIDSSQALSPH